MHEGVLQEERINHEKHEKVGKAPVFVLHYDFYDYMKTMISSCAVEALKGKIIVFM
jgi:hypothetical protein